MTFFCLFFVFFFVFSSAFFFFLETIPRRFALIPAQLVKPYRGFFTAFI